jgi:hypothetical protein
LDNGTPAKSYTNEVSYIVAGYVNLQLPAPIVLETFESTPEGSLPPGWSSTSLDGLRDLLSEPEFNLTNLDSATYTNWTVVDAARFNSPFDVYSIAYNGGVPDPGSMSDYQRVLTVNPSNVVNGVFLRSLASNHIAFGNSGYRSDVLGQILFLFSPDFNLTGRSNVYLSFHSLWEQNQDSVASVEYSIDMGATWLPAKYLINATDIFTNLDGTVDGLRTLTNIDASGTAYWLDSGGNTNGGYYGAFIGVASNLWGTLGPYISGRIDDNPLESKRVELIQLPLADNQSKVRLRFAHAGTDSWYWGVDNVGLYSLPAAGPLRIQSIVRNGPNVVISWNGGPGIELQKSTSLINPNWQDVPGTLGASSATEPIGSGEAYYRLIQ